MDRRRRRRSWPPLLGLGTPHRRTRDAPKPTSLLHRAALGPGLVLMLGLIPFTGFAAFLAVYGPDIGLDDTGPVFFAYAGMVLAIRIFGAKLPDRLGWQRASTIALGVGRLRRARPRPVGVGRRGVDGRGPLGLGMSLLYPALFSAALEDVPDHERSQAVGTFSLFFDLSQGVGAPLLGSWSRCRPSEAPSPSPPSSPAPASGPSAASAARSPAAGPTAREAGRAPTYRCGATGSSTDTASRRYPLAPPVKAHDGEPEAGDVDDAALVADELGVVADAEHVAGRQRARRPTGCSGGSAPAG